MINNTLSNLSSQSNDIDKKNNILIIGSSFSKYVLNVRDWYLQLLSIIHLLTWPTIFFNSEFDMIILFLIDPSTYKVNL